MVNSVGEALRIAAQQIEKFDAQYLLSTLLGVSRASLIAHTERSLTNDEAALFSSQLSARASGVPVAQIIGKREFYGRDFAINAHVLIPRPETELLITLALAGILSNKLPKTSADIRVCDLGTGSGAIAVTLACEAPQCDVTAVDISPLALALAQQNALQLNAKVNFIQSNWYNALSEQTFHLIVANPPYIAKNDPHLSEGDLRFEPLIALTDESEDGLSSIRTIVNHAPQYLVDGGMLMIEHGYDQAELAREIFIAAGFTDVKSVNDLAGIARVTHGKCCQAV
jgi:release factor glutamine methyltransferase